MTDDLVRRVRRRAGHRCEDFIGLTAIGRTTVQVLAINDPVMVRTREALIAEGRFPPR